MDLPSWEGGDSYIKVTGVIVGNFEINSKKVPEISFLWVWLKFIFTPRGTNSKTQLVPSCYGNWG